MTVESRPIKAPSEGEFGKLFYLFFWLMSLEHKNNKTTVASTPNLKIMHIPKYSKQKEEFLDI